MYKYVYYMYKYGYYMYKYIYFNLTLNTANKHWLVHGSVGHKYKN